MITCNKYADRPNRSWMELYGLSTDEKPIKNVKFELLKSDKVSRATDKDGNEIGVLTTDDNGRIEISNLLFGTYYLKELETEDVYILNDELVESKEIYNLLIEKL